MRQNVQGQLDFSRPRQRVKPVKREGKDRNRVPAVHEPESPASTRSIDGGSM